MNTSESQFGKGHVKVHASLLDPKNPDSFKRQQLRGALRTKGKLDAFGSSNTFEYKGKHGIEPQAEIGVADDNRNGTYVISDNPDKTPTKFKQ